MSIKKIVIGIIILGILAAGYIWFFVYNKAHVDYQDSDAVFIGYADSLHQEAVEDGSTFVENYVNEAVEVEGTVVEVGHSSFKIGNGMICTVDTAFREYLPEIGDFVTVKGRVVGADEDILTSEIICKLDQCVILSK